METMINILGGLTIIALLFIAIHQGKKGFFSAVYGPEFKNNSEDDLWETYYSILF